MDMHIGSGHAGPFVGLPPSLNTSITHTKHYFQALDNFCRVFAIRAGGSVLMLTDPLLDPRVIDAISGLAKARGASVTAYMAPSPRLARVPEELQPLLRVKPHSSYRPGSARSKTRSTSLCARPDSGG